MGIWLIKLTVLTAALYALYHGTLRENTFFGFNRHFLLLGMLLAVALPFVPLEFEQALPFQVQEVSENVFQIGAPITIHIDADLTGRFWIFFEYIYWAGVILLLLVRYGNVRQIIRYIKEGKRTSYPQFTLIENPLIPSSFSFLCYIVLPAGINEADKRIILVHEQTHVTQRHSIDLFLGELFCVVQWFNPFAWLYKNDMVENHEFLADCSASRTCGIQAYKETLIRFWLYGKQKNLVNPFAYSTQLMRLCMLKKPASSALRKGWVMGVIPILVVYGCLFVVPTSSKTTIPDSAQVTIMGNITNETHNKIVGASIIIPTRQLGTISDIDGSFELSVYTTDTFYICMKGYEKQQFCVSDHAIKKRKLQLDIQLQPLNK